METEYELNGYTYWYDATNRLWRAVKGLIKLQARTLGDIQALIA